MQGAHELGECKCEMLINVRPVPASQGLGRMISNLSPVIQRPEYIPASKQRQEKLPSVGRALLPAAFDLWHRLPSPAAKSCILTSDIARGMFTTSG